MGANISSAVNKVQNNLVSELDQAAGANGYIQCSVDTGNINIRKSKNSSVENINKCLANSSVALDAVSKAAAKTWAEASQEQKTSLPLLGVNASSSVQDVETSVKNILRQKCQADAFVANSIATKDIVIEECDNVIVKNINAGSAVANCGIKTVMSTVSEAYAESTQKQKTGDLFGDFGEMFQKGGIYIVSFYVICCCCCCILLLMMGVGGYMYTTVSGDIESGKFDKFAEKIGNK
ncbi:myristylated IMV envelope protein [Klosneuvirus KNV1]|uniref:Myristylated IMV envelope protein n=1 Tax=Klosneuvirus KNV1 TaxID=1977640 RepID=A0A1V0SL86_9VIRU|nr:myristylated IMV envelope protein [Klosneuvirus KNV1]